jgi:catechol 2,3-dioxygenase-like lactoylglutathione lyase family enzyme
VKISHFRHVALRTPELERSATFYEKTWGLEPVATDGPARLFRARSPEHHQLELHPGDERRIDHIAFAVPDDAALRDAHGELAKAGVRLLGDPAPIQQPGGGTGFRFVDPDGRVIELSCGVATLEPLDGPDRPVKVSHVVLNTPDIDRAKDFYVDVLGFRVSDWSEHQMVFLRCNRDHHTVAFNQAEWASLNHVAYEMPDIDQVMRGIGRLKAAGHELLWGPGRHGPGNNVFAYFQDPGGFVCEYTSEVMQVDEATWEPNVWERRPDLMDRWGTSGPPRPEARTAMANVPDPGTATA